MDKRRKPHSGGKRERPPKKEVKRERVPREVFFRVFPEGSDLDAAHQKAQRVLSRRPRITDEYAELFPKHGKDITAHDRANDAQLTDIFAYEDELLQKRDPIAFKTKQENKAISDIFEAMVLDVAPKLFSGADVQAVLPSQLDDRKQGVDVLLIISNPDGTVRSALALDMATETDLDGYDDGNGGIKGGVVEKVSRSHRNVFTKFNNLMRVKYAEVNGKKMVIEHAPRVLVGGSKDAVKALSKKWVDGTLDPKNEPLFKQIVASMSAQLATLSLSARLKEKKGGGKKSSERTHIHRVHKDFSSRLTGVPVVTTTDPVINRILATTKRGERVGIREHAFEDQNKMNEDGFSSDAGKPLDEKLSEEEQEKLTVHLQKKSVDPRIVRALTDFISGVRNDFHPAWIPAVAGGIPTRLYRRLRSAASSTAVFEKAKPDTHSEGASEPESLALSSAAHHLAAISGARVALGAASEKYKTKWGRAWSRVGEWGARFLGAKLGGLVGVGLGTLACMGAWTVIPAFAGAALSQLGLNWWFKKKFKFDERDKLAAIDSLERDAQRMPYTYKQKIKSSGLSEKEWVEKELERRTKWGKIRRAVIGAVAGGALSLEAGAQLYKGKSLFGELARDWVTGKRSWSDVWGMFCAGDWWKGKAPAPAGAGARGAALPPGAQRGSSSLFSPNDYDIARRRSLARASCGQHQRWCDIPQWEAGSRPGFRKLAENQSFVNRFGSGRWR